MAANPMKIRFNDANLKNLEKESYRTNKTITRIVNDAVDHYLGDIGVSTLFAITELPSVIRVRSTSTTFDIERLCELFRQKNLQRIVFAARKDNLNERCMVAYLESTEAIFLLDKTMINHAREPRIMEIEDLFKTLGNFELESNLACIPELVPYTGNLSVEQAWIKLKDIPTIRFNLASYLDLLAPKQDHSNLIPYRADKGYTVKLFRSHSHSRDEPVYTEAFLTKEDAHDHYNKIIENSIVCDEIDGYWLELLIHGVYVEGVNLSKFSLPDRRATSS